MNISLVLYVVGNVLFSEAVLMLLPVFVALLMGTGDWIYFIYTIVPLALVGFLLRL